MYVPSGNLEVTDIEDISGNLRISPDIYGYLGYVFGLTGILSENRGTCPNRYPILDIQHGYLEISRDICNYPNGYPCKISTQYTFVYPQLSWYNICELSVNIPVGYPFGYVFGAWISN